jgi:hypothetical protein
VVSPDSFPTGNKLLLGGAMLIFVLGALLSLWAVWKILSNTDEAGSFTFLGKNTTVRLYSFAYIPAAIAVLCMILMLAATLVFGSLANTALPDWFAGNFGLLLINTTISFGLTLAIMAISTILAFIGLVRGYPEWKKA